MPYDGPLTLVRLQGVFGDSAATPQEVWSMGVHFQGAYAPGGYVPSLTSMWGAVQAYIGSTTAGVTFADTTWATEIMAASILPNGKLAGGYFDRYAGTPQNGTATLSNCPIDMSFAVTLDAGKPAAGRFGRFYPPAQGCSLHVGQDTVALATAKLTAAKAFLQSLAICLANPSGSGPETPWPLVVASSAHAVNRHVANIRMGRVPDVQRRRRNALPEGYIAQAWT